MARSHALIAAIKGTKKDGCNYVGTACPSPCVLSVMPGCHGQPGLLGAAWTAGRNGSASISLLTHFFSPTSGATALSSRRSAVSGSCARFTTCERAEKAASPHSVKVVCFVESEDPGSGRTSSRRSLGVVDMDSLARAGLVPKGSLTERLMADVGGPGGPGGPGHRGAGVIMHHWRAIRRGISCLVMVLGADSQPACESP